MRGLLVLVVLALLHWAAAAGPLAGAERSPGDPPQASLHRCAHALGYAAGAQAAAEPGAIGAESAEGAAPHCATCHTHAAATAAAAPTLADPAGLARAGYAEHAIPASWSERPYRPQWRTPRVRG